VRTQEIDGDLMLSRIDREKTERAVVVTNLKSDDKEWEDQM
jgi:hypothetical protein